MNRRRILVTNDDGPSTTGLAVLVRAAACDEDRDVVVAIPAHDVSSTGTALGPIWDTAVRARRISRIWPWPAVSGTFEIDTFPSTIVTLASMGAFGSPPDLVLVGVNHGANVGRGLLHSSTVGAALTAAMYRIPAAAVSAAGTTVEPSGWDPFLAKLVAALLDHRPSGGALNVNLPERADAEPVPEWCRVADADAVGTLNRTASAGDELAFRLAAGPLTQLPPADTDAGVIARGRVALTWLTLPYAGSVPERRSLIPHHLSNPVARTNRGDHARPRDLHARR